MAKRLSYSVSTYSNYENNYREPKLDLIHKICDELDTSLDELLGISTMSSELINEVSKHLSKDDAAYVKKESNKIFQKQLNGIELTEDFAVESATAQAKEQAAEQIKLLTEIPEYRKNTGES